MVENKEYKRVVVEVCSPQITSLAHFFSFFCVLYQEMSMSFFFFFLFFEKQEMSVSWRWKRWAFLSFVLGY